MDAIALAVGEASIRDEDYFQQTCRKVSTTRDRSAEALRALGFTVLPSLTNFLFVTQDRKSTRLNSSHITRSRMPSSA